MDLDLEPREREFHERLRGWLDTIMPPSGLRDYGATPTAADIDSGRAWQRMLCDAGWAALSWPTPEGAGATVAEQAIFAEELAIRGLPRQLSFVSMELAGPILISYGTPEQKSRFLPAIRQGDSIWCQLFSEPEAGSDLASLRTRAEPVEGGWRLTGQKIWTSGAHYSDHGLILARTDPSGQRHRGITCFALPMNQPGITVKPIRQMDGESKFNEVFLDGVEVTDADVVGSVDEGWSVAVSILGRERRMLGSLAIGLASALQDIRRQAEDSGRVTEGFQHRWSTLSIRVNLLRWTWFRLLSSGDSVESDPRMSVLKLTASGLIQDVSALAIDTLGYAAVAGPGSHRWTDMFLASHGSSLAGGTSQIQREILGDRVLGLPR